MKIRGLTIKFGINLETSCPDFYFSIVYDCVDTFLTKLFPIFIPAVKRPPNLKIRKAAKGGKFLKILAAGKAVFVFRKIKKNEDGDK